MMTKFGSSDVFPGREISLFDGSRINPIEEAALVLDTASGNTEENFEDDLLVGVITWLHSSLKNDAKDSPTTSSESSGSSYEHSLCENSSVFEGSHTSLSTHEDSSSSQLSDFDRTGSWVSLLDLEGEDLAWKSDKVQAFDAIQSDCTSPYHHLNRNMDACFSDSSVASIGDEKSSNIPSKPLQNSEKQTLVSIVESNLKCPTSDEPLYWPFQHNYYTSHKMSCDSLCKSPANISNMGKSATGRKTTPVKGKNVLQGSPRKSFYRPTSASPSILNGKISNETKGVSKTMMCPSRLSASFEFPNEQHSCNATMKKKPFKMNRILSLMKDENQSELQYHKDKHHFSKNRIKLPIITEQNHPKELSPGGENDDFLISFKSQEEVPIEALVGLNEFSGHEGIEDKLSGSQLFAD